jgi:hypothetical protein
VFAHAPEKRVAHLPLASFNGFHCKLQPSKRTPPDEPAAINSTNSEFRADSRYAGISEGLENPIFVPGALSFLAHGQFSNPVRGFNDCPLYEWPDNIELVCYV